MDNHSFNHRALRFIHRLKQLDGAIDYDGDASSQVIFELANGKTLRIGITDEDVGGISGIWCDQYEGLLHEFSHKDTN